MKVVAEWLSQARAIYLSMICFIGLGVWAADTRYLKIEDAEGMVQAIKIDSANNAIERQIDGLLEKNADLGIERLYVERPNQRNMIDALIKKNEKRVEQLRHEQEMIDK